MFASQDLKAGTFLGIYAGELIFDEDGETRLWVLLFALFRFARLTRLLVTQTINHICLM